MLTPEILEPFVRLACSMSADELFGYLQTIGFTVVDYGTETGHRWSKDTTKNRYAIRPGLNEDSPLLVCHADTVRPITSYHYDNESGKVTSLGLDDRLGIALMLYGIAYGELYDCAMLVCDNEEIGCSTASQFVSDQMTLPTIVPNMLIEFDRRGDDVVTYCFGDTTLHSLLQSVGFRIGQGSFSDICSMEEMEVKGINVGIGYHREHSNECYAMLDDTCKQYDKTLQFLALFGHVRLDHTIVKRVTSHWDNPRQNDTVTISNDWDDIADNEDDNDGWYMCDSCGFNCLETDDGCNELHNGLVCDSCLDCSKYLAKRVQ